MSAVNAVPRTLPKSLTDHAVSEIRAMILSGELPEGGRLIEQNLTDALGVSRPPLREALRILEAEGFITTEARRGSRVISFSEQDVHEILTLRAALERLAIELGVPVTDAALIEPVRAAMRRIEACATAEDRSGIITAGYVFHSAVVGIAGHSRLSDAYESVHLQQLLCTTRNLIGRSVGHEDLQHNVARHRGVLDAIESGSRSRTLEALEAHDDSAEVRG